jgi:hypothetical protein
MFVKRFVGAPIGRPLDADQGFLSVKPVRCPPAGVKAISTAKRPLESMKNQNNAHVLNGG